MEAQFFNSKGIGIFSAYLDYFPQVGQIIYWNDYSIPIGIRKKYKVIDVNLSLNKGIVGRDNLPQGTPEEKIEYVIKNCGNINGLNVEGIYYVRSQIQVSVEEINKD